MATSPNDTEEENYYSRGEEHLSIKSASHYPEFLQFLECVHCSEELSDIKIKCQDGSFPAHKFVLASQSPYLRTIFIEDSSLSILKVDSDAKVLGHCLEYLYTGKTVVNINRAAQLGRLSEKWGIRGMMEQCVLPKYDLTNDNCVEKWKTARDSEDKNLEKEAMTMILRNFKSLQTSGDVLRLSHEKIKILLSHPNLDVESLDERVACAVRWVKYNPDALSDHIRGILDSLPLDSTHLRLFDNLMRCDQPLKTRVDQCEQMLKAVANAKQYQHCLLIAGAGCEKKDPSHFYSMSTSLLAPCKSICNLPVRDTRGDISICLRRSSLCVSGLGSNRRQVWQFDLTETERGWIECPPLLKPRSYHSMCEINNKLYVVGGVLDSSRTKMNTNIEVLDCVAKRWKMEGKMEKGECTNTCCAVLNNSDILVVDGEMKESVLTLQIYSTAKRRVTQKHTLPGVGPNWVYGVVVAGDHVIIITERDTYICSVTNLSNGRFTDIEIQSGYRTPNRQCAVSQSVGQSHVLLVGGTPRTKEKSHYLYRAAVSDIIANTGSGWQKIKGDATIGKWTIIGGATCCGMIPSRRMIHE